jgi:long-chain fatty acid transport protein
VDAEKTASGITPIVSINIQPIDMLNIAVRYELKTSLEFTNSTADNKGGLVGFEPDGTPVYLFPDGAKANLDLPAILAVGATLQPIDALLISAGMTYYFDKESDWNGREDLLDANTWDIGLGGEFALSDKFKVSAGWSMTKTSPGPNYQTDLSYTLPTQAMSFGLGYNIMENIQLNLGGQYVIYETGSRTFQHDFANTGAMMDITETLEKGVWIAAVGLNISLAR